MNKNKRSSEGFTNEHKGDYSCPAYDIKFDSCHEYFLAGLLEKPKWVNKKEGFLNCKGNRHICNKLKYKWLASL